MKKLYIVRIDEEYWVSQDFEITMLVKDSYSGYDGKTYWNRGLTKGPVAELCQEDFEKVTDIRLDEYEYCVINLPEFE